MAAKMTEEQRENRRLKRLQAAKRKKEAAEQARIETERMIQRFSDEIDELKSQLKQYRECRAAFGVLEPEEREPETEVGYLRRQLAYAEGQLHQSHLAVKVIAARINLHADPLHPEYVTPKPVDLSEKSLEAIYGLWDSVRTLLANQINDRDLAAAGITPPVTSLRKAKANR